MAESADGASDVNHDERRCYRCGGHLDETHWVRLSTEHRGLNAGTFADVSRPFCPDCAAAVGLLEHAVERERRSSRSAIED